MSFINMGYDPHEIKELKLECEEAESNFVFAEDEEGEGIDEYGEFANIQFVGKHNGKDVIYDAMVFTLRMHYESVLYEKAEKEVMQHYPDYICLEERDDKYVPNEEAEEMIEELIEQMEEEDVIKVQEQVEKEIDGFEYGIGLEVCLNVEELTENILTKFVDDFNSGNLKLDNTLYSFKSEEEE